MTRFDILIVVVVAGFVVCWLVLRRIEFYAARCLNELEQIKWSSDRTSDNTSALTGPKS
jgi:hypothetical protein